MDGTEVPATDGPIVLLVAGGPGVARVPRDLTPGSVVVAADSGADVLAAAGLAPDVLVGDLDSISTAALRRAEGSATRIERHPPDKDATDLELALAAAVELSACAEPELPIVVVAPGGGRVDLELGDLLLLGAAAAAGRSVRAQVGAADIWFAVAGRGAELAGHPGTQVSIIPLHGAADGVTTSGLRWPLLDAHLAPGTTRALSNELIGGPATVDVRAGTVAVIAPGTVAPPIAPRATAYDPTPRRNDP